MHIIFCLKADTSSALDSTYRLRLSWNLLCLMRTEMKMHFIYSTLMLFYSKLMLMEWGKTSTWLGQANPMTEKNQEHRLPLRPVLWCTLLLERVIMLVKSLNVTPKSLGPASSPSFHLQNEEVNWSSAGEQLTCSIKHRELVCLFSELTSMKVSMRPYSGLLIHETIKV